MYVQITERCNMLCEHCCFNCNSEGDDIKMSTLDHVLKFAEHHGENLVIGGGEPTLHKKFQEILLRFIMVENYDEFPPHIITNGTHEKYSLMIAKLSKAESVLTSRLSFDLYHDIHLISERVKKAFGFDERYYGDDLRVYAQGRANFGDKGCACEELFITPRGEVKYCGCLTAPIIFQDIREITDDIFSDICQATSDFGECWSDLPEEKQVEIKLYRSKK